MAQISPRVQAALDRHGLPVSLFETAIKERNWTDSRMAVLGALIESGEFSFTDAAEALGNTSRAAVGSKADRLGLSNGLTRREAQAKKDKTLALKREAMRRARDKAAPKPTYVSPFKPRDAEPAAFSEHRAGPVGGVALIDLGNTDCRNPLPGPNDKDPFAERFFCGAPGARPFGGQFPYCPRCLDDLNIDPNAKAEAERRKGRAVVHIGRGSCNTVFGQGQSKGWARA